jgi:hypothetical protein
MHHKNFSVVGALTIQKTHLDMTMQHVSISPARITINFDAKNMQATIEKSRCPDHDVKQFIGLNPKYILFNIRGRVARSLHGDFDIQPCVNPDGLPGMLKIIMTFKDKPTMDKFDTDSRASDITSINFDSTAVIRHH